MDLTIDHLFIISQKLSFIQTINLKPIQTIYDRKEFKS
jgi:hypothetical protein